MYEHYRKSKQLISAMPAITYHTREQFLKGYDFPLSPAQDFKQNGHPAEYASGHPWPASWHSNAEAIDFSNELKEKNKGASTTLHSSLSSDQRLLAISSSLERILIYDVASKELRATLEGTGHIVFRPVQDPEINGS
jgi:hypothetical protein